jgi:hypothetical protein
MIMKRWLVLLVVMVLLAFIGCYHPHPHWHRW